MLIDNGLHPMIQIESKRNANFKESHMKKIIFLFFILSASAFCAENIKTTPEDLMCRIVRKLPNGQPFEVITDVEGVNTTSTNPEDYTIRGTLRNSAVLEAMVKNVKINLPRDRFLVTLKLDGKPYMRVSHIDLDIFIEISLDSETYIFHCMPPFVPMPQIK